MNISEFFIFVGLIFDSLWYSIAMNCGGRLRTTPEKSLMRRALFFCPELSPVIAFTPSRVSLSFPKPSQLKNPISITSF